MSQISAPGGLDLATNSGLESRFNELRSEDFIKIIFTELSNQDPFEPNDSSALLEQLNSIRSIESDIQLTEQLESIVFENQLASAGNLIGKSVQGLSTQNNPVTGVVSAAVREDDQILLELEQGRQVPIENVSQIVDPAANGLSSGNSPDEKGPSA